MKHANPKPKNAKEALAYVRKHAERTKDGHRVWTGYVTTTGQPRARFDGSRTFSSARKVIYEATKGPVPEKHRVMLSCDCHGCVEPDHLVAVPPEGQFTFLIAQGAMDTVKYAVSRKKAAERRRVAPVPKDAPRPMHELVPSASIFSLGAALGRQQAGAAR